MRNITYKNEYRITGKSNSVYSFDLLEIKRPKNLKYIEAKEISDSRTEEYFSGKLIGLFYEHSPTLLKPLEYFTIKNKENLKTILNNAQKQDYNISHLFLFTSHQNQVGKTHENMINDMPDSYQYQHKSIIEIH